MRGAFGLLGVLGYVWLVTASPVSAQTSASMAPAEELAALMTAGKMDAIAAQHPSEPDRFVAALYFPGTLLVVSARYSAPSLLVTRLENGEYRDTYVELNGAALPDSKIFVQDVGANGLMSSSGNADSYETGGTNVVFNREWRDQSLPSEEDYDGKYQAADAAYAEMLNALLAQAKG